MTILNMELAETVRFALKATQELDPSDFHAQKNSVAKLGVELGHEVAKALASGKKKELYAELESFWMECGLGSMELIQPSPLVIRLDGCFDCTHRMGAPPISCTFRKSLLETIFQDALGTTASVQMVECCKGESGCTFRLKVG